MKIVPMEVTYLGGFGGDITVVNAARVSFKKGVDEMSAKDEKLIAYLAKHKHFSPFNHAFLSFRIKAPIFVARQLVKHKFMPWNEESRRYVDDEPEFFFPDVWRGRAENVKQGSSGSIDPKDLWVYDINDEYICEPKGLVEENLHFYKEFLKKGVAPEQARMVLPQNTMTEWIWSGTLGAFLAMLVLRLDPHTQQETREVAQQIARTVKAIFPVSFSTIEI